MKDKVLKLHCNKMSIKAYFPEYLQTVKSRFETGYANIRKDDLSEMLVDYEKMIRLLKREGYSVEYAPKERIKIDVHEKNLPDFLKHDFKKLFRNAKPDQKQPRKKRRRLK